ncbi:hypothetical protein B0H14DRAFT_3679635 [Mycena olivaceomarginata]|nr:hypothetical protein B0H14DRAFT_3679635 [Mycena olivaceomarginata]
MEDNAVPDISSTKESTSSSSSAAPPKARPKPKPEDRLRSWNSALSPINFTSGDVDADSFAPNYQLAHALPSGLITSAAPLTYDDDSDPEDESEQVHAKHTASSSTLATSPPPPVSRSVSPAPVSPAPSDNDMDKDVDNTPDYGKLVNDPGFGALIPTSRDENPHKPYRGFVASGLEDHAGVPFQKYSGGGAGLVMSHNTAMTNVQPRVVGFIAEDPDSFILFIPFLGGAHCNKEYRDAASDLTNNLEQITGAGGIEIYPPAPHEKEDFAGHVMYHPPWVLVGKCKSKEVRDELARHQLIACSRDLAVHVFKVDFLRMSWLLGHWRCNTLVPISLVVLHAAVATPLSPRARSAPPSCTPLRTRRAQQTSVYAGLFRCSTSLALPSAAEPPLWIVYGQPCSESHAVWESIRDLFRNASVTKGLSEFTPIGSPSHSTGSTTRRLALYYICKLTARTPAHMPSSLTGSAPKQSSVPDSTGSTITPSIYSFYFCDNPIFL